MSCVFVAAAAAFICAQCSGAKLEEFQVATEASYEEVLQKWVATEKKMEKVVTSLMERILPEMIRSMAEVDISLECTAALLRLINRLKELKKWPLLMVDASGKLASGLLSGSWTVLGSYDQCIDIAEHDEHTQELLMQGQYCVVDARFPLPKKKRLLSIYETIPLLENFTANNYMKNLLMWCLTTVVMATVIFISCTWNGGAVTSSALSALYLGVHRIGWSFGLSWIIFACFTGCGGIINSFLSWPGFIPLSRLTFMAYLWHYVIITVYYSYWRLGIEANNVFTVWMFFGNLCVTYGISLMANLLYDALIGQMEKAIFGSFLPRNAKEATAEDSDKTLTVTNGNTNHNELSVFELNGKDTVRL